MCESEGKRGTRDLMGFFSSSKLREGLEDREEKEATEDRGDVVGTEPMETMDKMGVCFSLFYFFFLSFSIFFFLFLPPSPLLPPLLLMFYF
jgi:hypothetical protein